MNEKRGWPSDADVTALLTAGFTKQTALEVVSATAFKVMSNYTNHLASTDLDAAFTLNQWSADRAKVA